MVLENNLFSVLFNFLVNVFIWFISFVSNLIFTPIETILKNIIPDYSSFLHYIYDFFDMATQYVGFVKEVFIDYLCINRDLLNLLLLLFITKQLLIPGLKTIVLMYNVWKLKSGN